MEPCADVRPSWGQSMAIKASAFLALETSLTDRLQRSLRKVTTAVYKQVTTLLSSGDFDAAERLINSISLSKVMEDNKAYVSYMTDMAMLFGASRVTPDPGASVVGMGHEKMVTHQAVQALSTLIVQKGEFYIKTTALQLIAQARKDAQVVVEKANPYHDEKGRFSSKEHSVVSVGGGPISGEDFDEWTHGKTSMNGKEIRLRHFMEVSEMPLDEFKALVKSLPEGRVGVEPINGLVTLQSEVTLSSVRGLALSKTDKEKYSAPAKHDHLTGLDSRTGMPLIVISGGVRTILNGNHRVVAALARGDTHIRAEVVNLDVVKKAERPRILKPFASFMNDAGDAFFDLASSLHTSRVSSYGFTAEALALGYEEYQINEQLDSHICPVCAEMHGKTFKVADARALLGIALRVENPDDLKSLQPWPKQDKATVESIKSMTPEELVSNHWHIPPFHPKCRGLLGRVGKVPTKEQITTGVVDQGYTATKEDFKALGASFSQAAVGLWNKYSDISPIEFAARLQGTTVEELQLRLLESKKAAISGILGMSGSKNISLRMERAGFGTSLPFYQNIQIKPSMNALYINAVELAAEDQGSGMMKKYMRELVSVARDMGLPAINMTAGLDVGGYAWAKYGFAPSSDSWANLVATVSKKIADGNLLEGISTETKAVVNTLLNSTDPTSIFVLSDLTEKTKEGVAIGKALLLGTEWSGGLELGNQTAMTRFLSYIGGQ